ncbi:MAG TPA: hypothetical protein PLG17_08270 [Thermodesulfobacteriota bacterium]|nr:hypothetical protein [Deltaproteobacteria bacterium]HNR13402.1 hypothetical protein [Thermodesulfobacteriota bacterium]HNU72014.1 hypothetical protein [Thermodesulfobacteriota bacterium]HOC38284.1 hypothetical protein [Thermodesulfobacteriota bacterium]HQO78493.1 hypothetical protein [Thermodesulfobacteriota bacterium]
MKMAKALAVISIMAALALTWCIALPDLSYSQEDQKCAIITMHGDLTQPGAQALLRPETVSVDKGDCVIWLNNANGFEAVVKFAEGKVCEDATEAPSGFTMTAQNCYVSTSIPTGGTSSLRFTESGIYAYEVTDTKDVVVTRGKVLVKD